MAARKVLQRINPDWVSLQFVSYAYHRKGLAFGMARHLPRLCAGFKIHLMLHELWIGESTEYGWKDRLVGQLQKWSILLMVKRLRAAVIHTSNPVYVELLRRQGVAASELALFGNIPLASMDSEWLHETLASCGVAFTEASRERVWAAGLFGTIHPQWSLEPWLDELCQAADREGRRLCLVHFGAAGEDGVAVWKRMEARYRGRCEFAMLGQQSSERISSLLQWVDFGIATSPWALIGKSGTAAAMLDHGVPVLVTRDDWRLRLGPTPEPTQDPLLFRFGPKFLELLGRGLRRQPEPRLPRVATEFLRSLSDYSETCQTAQKLLPTA